MADLIIDQEFLDLLPHPSDETDAELMASLKDSGKPLDSLKVWRGENIIVDGMRRFQLCQKLGLPYEIDFLDFPDRQAAKRWMLGFQLCRRNVSGPEAKTLRARLYEIEVANGKPAMEAIRSAATATGTSERTIHRAVEWQRAIDSLEPDIRERLQSLNPKSHDATEFAEYPVEHQRAILSEVESGEYSSLAAALHGEGADEDDAADPDPEPVVEPPSPRPAPPPVSKTGPRSATEYFASAAKKLGFLKTGIEELGNAYPGSEYRNAMDLLDEVGRVLEDWKRREADEP